MSTKSQRYRYEVERSGQPRPKVAKHGRPHSVDTSLPGVSATDRHAALSAAERNRSEHAARKAAYTLEDGGKGKPPSRKSTRKAANRQKPGSNLKRLQTRKTRSPAARAARGARG